MRALPLPDYDVRVVSGSGKNDHIEVVCLGNKSLQTTPA